MLTKTHNLDTETGAVTDTVDGWAVSCECDVPTLVTRGALRNLSVPLALLPYKSISENDLFLTGGRWIHHRRKTCGAAQARGGRQKDQKEPVGP